MSASGIPTLLTDAVVSRLEYINKEIVGIDKEDDSNIFKRLKGHSKPQCRISLTYEIGDKLHKVDRFSNNLPPKATMLKINDYFFNANHVEQGNCMKKFFNIPYVKFEAYSPCPNQPLIVCF